MPLLKTGYRISFPKNVDSYILATRTDAVTRINCTRGRSCQEKKNKKQFVCAGIMYTYVMNSAPTYVWKTILENCSRVLISVSAKYIRANKIFKHVVGAA